MIRSARPGVSVRQETRLPHQASLEPPRSINRGEEACLSLLPDGTEQRGSKKSGISVKY
jgi:hypothetical protein